MRDAIAFAPPIVEHLAPGLYVVRDDHLQGGTKLRYLADLFRFYAHIVYATPAEGGAQLALAHAAKMYGGEATIFTAARAEAHPRTVQTSAAGADVRMVRPGYLSVVQKRAKDFATQTGAYLLPFGGDTTHAHMLLAAAAVQVRNSIPLVDEVWSAAGSGTLSRALQEAFPDAEVYAVQVGRDLTARAAGRARVVKHPLSFAQRCKYPCPFPSDPHYDRKAWELFETRQHRGTALFWNVLGDLRG